MGFLICGTFSSSDVYPRSVLSIDPRFPAPTHPSLGWARSGFFSLAVLRQPMYSWQLRVFRSADLICRCSRASLPVFALHARTQARLAVGDSADHRCNLMIKSRNTDKFCQCRQTLSAFPLQTNFADEPCRQTLQTNPTQFAGVPEFRADMQSLSTEFVCNSPNFPTRASAF